MRKVVWTDRRGWKKVSLVRDTDPDTAAPQGLPAGPPDLSEVDCQEVLKEINNRLVDEGLLEIRDLSRQPNAITQAVRAAMVGRIVSAYKRG
jgi:hypothetical protein